MQPIVDEQIGVKVGDHWGVALHRGQRPAHASYHAGMFGEGGGRKDMVELLLSHGAKADARDNGGRTAIFWALKGGHKDVAELLKERMGMK